MAHALWRWRSAAGSLIFWWISGAAVGIALIQDSLSTPRYLVMFPGIALAMGLGFSGTLALLRLPARLERGIFGLTVLAILSVQGGYYFGVHLPNYYADRIYSVLGEDGQPLVDTDDALLRAIMLPPNTEVYIFSRPLVWDFNTQTVREYWGRMDLTIRHYVPRHLPRVPLHELPPDRNYAFFLEPKDARTRYALERFFTFAPDPTGNDGLSPYPIPADVQLRLYFAPATAAPSGATE
jgi:hypothetical protein